MRIFLGLGSNLGDRRAHLEAALVRLHRLLRPSVFKVSPVYQTPALLPENAPDSWNQPYLNLAVEIQSPIEPRHLLSVIREIELQGGRKREAHWGPREIDIDILVHGKEKRDDDDLKLPHPEIHKRAFVLDPLRDLYSPYIAASRQHTDHQASVMGIVNLTPDSFSDGGRWFDFKTLSQELDTWDSHNVAYFDIGAESTRPGAAHVTPFEEWHRLKPALELAREKFHGRFIKPKISVDTRHYETAVFAIEFGADVINDVSGLTDPRFPELIKSSEKQYVLMHSLSVPADPQRVFAATADPIAELKAFFEQKLNLLFNSGVRSDQIILDPGLGFGKTAAQSQEIVNRIDELHSLGLRILVGHSRKSFLGAHIPPVGRDPASLQLSRYLKSKAEILRVHDPLRHQEVLNE